MSIKVKENGSTSIVLHDELTTTDVAELLVTLMAVEDVRSTSRSYGEDEEELDDGRGYSGRGSSRRGRKSKVKIAFLNTSLPKFNSDVSDLLSETIKEFSHEYQYSFLGSNDVTEEMVGIKPKRKPHPFD